MSSMLRQQVNNCIVLCLGLIASQGVAFSASASEIPAELKGVGITEHLGERVSIQELTFRDETGKEVRLADFFRPGHPVLLSLVYYSCPNLCTFVLNGLLDSLKNFEWTPDKQFDIITVSIDPAESPELAAKKKAAYLKSYGRESAASGWHFLTGTQDQIEKLSQQVGFGFKKDPKDNQYAHSAAIFALTPDGTISRYLYGIEYPEKALRLALLEASNGKVGTLMDRLLMFCYRYDPGTKTYSIYSKRLMSAGGAGTVLVFGGYLAVFWRAQRRRRVRG